MNSSKRGAAYGFRLQSLDLVSSEHRSASASSHEHYGNGSGCSFIACCKSHSASLTRDAVDFNSVLTSLRDDRVKYHEDRRQNLDRTTTCSRDSRDMYTEGQLNFSETTTGLFTIWEYCCCYNIQEISLTDRLWGVKYRVSVSR